MPFSKQFLAAIEFYNYATDMKEARKLCGNFKHSFV